MHATIAKIERALVDHQAVAVAVSGGIDSLTLSVLAARALGERATLYHAVSPAVPPSATARVRRYASWLGVALHVIEAGEFNDEAYLQNPVNRCFFCKNNLYRTIGAHTATTILSGTNLDDLGDFRPGLQAAERHDVRHPFVETGVDKATIRALAAYLDLDDIAQLPAQPCLSSRVQTGIRVNAGDLHLVHEVEEQVTQHVGPGDIRCRIVPEGVRLELPESLFADSQSDPLEYVERLANRLCDAAGKRLVAVTPYRRGSAFVHACASGEGHG